MSGNDVAVPRSPSFIIHAFDNLCLNLVSNHLGILTFRIYEISAERDRSILSNLMKIEITHRQCILNLDVQNMFFREQNCSNYTTAKYVCPCSYMCQVKTYSAYVYLILLFIAKAIALPGTELQNTEVLQNSMNLLRGCP